MLEIEGPKSAFSSHKQSERKVNPLGKANKRFLGRTINTAVRHNRREVERTQANCRQKLKDLDDIHERRKYNDFYNRDASRNYQRSRSRSRSPSRSRSRHRIKKSKKRRSRKRSSSRSSRSPSRRRSHRKKNKKKTRKHRKSHHRSRRRRSSISSSCSRDRSSSPKVAIPTVVSAPAEVYLEHSKQMALAVAMAYGQALKTAAKERESSPMSDIVKELMSDDEENPNQIDALSISSKDTTVDNVLTIDVSSNSESRSNSSTDSSDAESEAASSAGSCIVLYQTDNNNSDIEIIECPDDKSKTVPENVNEKQQVKEYSALESVDLTED
ncbi:hypothetical protein KR054_005320 [Drosophila jambulina]|nr:hypothetical protein KR054_005320 [Drosophila jambulina]